MGDKGTQQFIPGVAPGDSIPIHAHEHPLSSFLPLEKGAPGERSGVSKKKKAVNKKKRKNAKKSRKRNR